MNNTLYSDKLIEVFDDSILLKNYYSPFGSKRVKYEDIEGITVYRTSRSADQYRYWGTGDFQRWYPPDFRRSKRDRIFNMKIKNKWWQPGFTVEDSQTVMDLLKDKCTIIDKS